jgi:hypothetical protein
MREIPLCDANANFFAVVDEAVNVNSAMITRHGKKQAVVLSDESGGLRQSQIDYADVKCDAARQNHH